MDPGSPSRRGLKRGGSWAKRAQVTNQEGVLILAALLTLNGCLVGFEFSKEVFVPEVHAQLCR